MRLPIGGCGFGEKAHGIKIRFFGFNDPVDSNVAQLTV
jgi:hypothetical protein